MCKVERRKITLPRFHSLDPVCFVFVRIILKGKGVYFTLQGRWSLYQTMDSPSKAMVYTAFAAKENGSDVVQVRKYGEYRNIDYLIYVAGINQSFVMFYDAATYELQNMCSIGLRGLML